MKKKLYLITDGFPYGTGEKAFILPELPYLMDEYEVTIVSPADSKRASDVKYITKLDDRLKLMHLIPLSTNPYKNAVEQIVRGSTPQEKFHFLQSPILNEEIELINLTGGGSSTGQNKRSHVLFHQGGTVLSTDFALPSH